MCGNYLIANRVCWRCGKSTVVYDWCPRGNWRTESPPEPIPKNIFLDKSSIVDEKYWANHCEHCKAIQGDWFLFDEEPLDWKLVK